MSTGGTQRAMLFLASGLLLLGLLLHARPLLSLLVSNAAWLSWNRTLGAAERPRETAATSWFPAALWLDGANQSAWLGQGQVAARTDDAPGALASWEQGAVTPDVLLEYGKQARAGDNPATALVYFQGAAARAAPEPNEGAYWAGVVCQQTLATPERLTPAQQTYCDGYFARNGRNLILNGQLATGNTWGWNGQFFFADPRTATFAVDAAAGQPAPSLLLEGVTAGPHRGLYQVISLPPGSRVRFSAKARTAADADFQVALLFIGWRADGRPQGNEFAVVTESTGWRTYEREFRLPADAERLVQFYPAVLSGRGQVWLDDVQLTLLPE